MNQSFDHGSFGETEIIPMTRIQKFASQALTQSWTTIPHVTHHDEADITALEALRARLNAEVPAAKLSLTAFLIKAATAALKTHPKLNASLDVEKLQVVLKRYYNIGVAIDTPSGLVVGVLHGCDRMSVREVATQMARLSEKARTKGLSLEEMSGGSFTVSSLGGIGGTSFTPIINAPEVAILGVGKARWNATRGPDEGTEWWLMVPLSLSYDHRVVNGADAARFVRALAETLAAPAALA